MNVSNNIRAIGALSLFAIAGMAQGDTVVFSTKLGDHPDGAAANPTYGIRLDNLFSNSPTAGGSLASGQSGTTTFSFDSNGAAMQLQAIDTNNSGDADTIRVFGTVYGGRDIGSGYGFGEGLYELDFTINSGVAAVEGPNGGLTATGQSASHGGFIRSVGNSDVAAGIEWNLFNMTNNSNQSFLFLQDGHRMAGHSNSLRGPVDPFVGRGWLTLNGTGANAGGTQDFLFVAVPLPTTGLMAMVGLGGLATIRRR